MVTKLAYDVHIFQPRIPYRNSKLTRLLQVYMIISTSLFCCKFSTIVSMFSERRAKINSAETDQFAISYASFRGISSNEITTLIVLENN